jgi:hypothetical protein
MRLTRWVSLERTVRSALPRGFGVAEVDLDSGVDSELGVFGHLFALVPGQRLPEMIRKPLDHFGETGPHRLGLVLPSGSRNSITYLDHRSTSVPTAV